MNGLPYYKAYPRDFIEGTIGMTFEVKAAYRLVLDLIYMQGGNLPDDAKYISGLLGCSVRKWNSLRKRLLEVGKIECENGFISNFRADKELITQRTLQEKNRENGAKSKKNNGLTKANVKLTRGLNTDTDKKNKTKKVVRPAGVEESLWSDFLAHRRSHRATLTETALKGFEREASKANLTLSQAITISIERGWRGFKADWIKPEDRPKQSLSKPENADDPKVNIGGRFHRKSYVMSALSEFMESGQWKHRSALGEPPGKHRCEIPTELISEAKQMASAQAA